MSRTYTAILRGDRLEWTGEAPPTATPACSVQVTIPNPVGDGVSEESTAGRRMADILRELARLDPFRHIEDAIAWQREIRKDRPLPGREP